MFVVLEELGLIDVLKIVLKVGKYFFENYLVGLMVYGK